MLSAFSSVTSAETLDFNDFNNLGLKIGNEVDGSMFWSGGDGEGHLYADDRLDDDSVLFYSTETYVNSFQMNAMAWEGFNRGNAGSIDIAGYNSSNQSVWSETVDLTAYTNWNNWLTVSVEEAGIAKLIFSATGNDGFWPSIDNMVINEVPLPASIWLLGTGLMGLFGLLRLPRRSGN